jgi:hypothetical protein
LAPSIEGAFQFISRKLPDGPLLRPPDFIGFNTYTKSHRNFNVVQKDATDKIASFSSVSTYTLNWNFWFWALAMPSHATQTMATATATGQIVRCPWDLHSLIIAVTSRHGSYNSSLLRPNGARDGLHPITLSIALREI